MYTVTFRLWYSDELRSVRVAADSINAAICRARTVDAALNHGNAEFVACWKGER